MNMNMPESNAHTASGTHWLKRMGVAGFTFFFLKGMAWLMIPWLAHAVMS